MLEIRKAKSIQGKVVLPPSPEAAFTTLALAVAKKISVRFAAFPDNPQWWRWIEGMGRRIVWEKADDGSLTITPGDAQDDSLIFLPYPDLPHADFTLFLLLGAKVPVAMEGLPESRVDFWNSIAKRFGGVIENKELDNARALYLKQVAPFPVGDLSVAQNDLHAYLGLAVGQGHRVEFDTGYVVITPLRHVLPTFGLSIEIRSANVHREEDPLVRRMRMFAQKKKGESKQAFRVTGDFSSKSDKPVEISLPGDDVLASILLLAKSLVQKGTLLIENAPVDSWALPALSLMRKMGCRPGIQEEGSTSFGVKGIVQPQLFDVVGRKTECVPFWQFREQIGPMVVLSCFAKGQSVFRRLEELRCDSPDRMQVLLSVVRILGARHGEMPDGIVVDGAKQFDGFDITDVLPAPIAGACAVAGFRCAGKTMVEDKSILERWPSFSDMVARISTYRT